MASISSEAPLAKSLRDSGSTLSAALIAVSAVFFAAVLTGSGIASFAFFAVSFILFLILIFLSFIFILHCLLYIIPFISGLL